MMLAERSLPVPTYSSTSLLLEAIELRLRQAAHTLARLRMAGMGPGTRMVMSDLIFVNGDLQAGYGYIAEHNRPAVPSAAAISQMDQVLQWVLAAQLPVAHRRLLWLRAEGRGWRRMGMELGLDPSTTRRHYHTALHNFITTIITRGMLS